MSFLDFFGARYALKLWVIAASVAAFVVMAGLINAMLVGVVAVWPEWAQTGAYMLPANTGACISTVMTATIVRWAYTWKLRMFMMIGNG